MWGAAIERTLKGPSTMNVKKRPALRVKRSSYNFHEIKTGHITEDWELVTRTATLEATRTVE